MNESDIVESYYLETREGLFFAVKGLEHPPDRWIAVLRYAPDAEKGDRKKNGKSYRRLYHFAEQEQWIQAAYPQYLAYDPVFQTILQSVPGSLVQRIYEGPYRCWKCRELFSIKIEGNEVKYLDPLSEEEFQRRQKMEAEKTKFKKPPPD